MKIKQSFFIICFTLLISNNNFAQQFYINGSVGIGLNGGGGIIENNYIYTGAAHNLSAAVGYSAYKNIINFEIDYSSISSNFVDGPDGTIAAYSINRKRIVPQLKIQFHDSKNSFYIKLGLLMDFAGIVEKDMLYTTFEGGNTSAPQDNAFSGYITEYNQGSLTYGFLWSIGYNFKIIEHLSAFFELNSSYLSWAPTHSEIIDGGGSNLSNFSIAQKQQDYVENPVSSNNPNKPKQVATQYYDFSNTGLCFGIIFYFGKIK